MESKIKHRLLGVMVVVALVFLLLPFMQRSKDAAPETAFVNAPPFPEEKETQAVIPDEPVHDDAEPLIEEPITKPAASPMLKKKSDADSEHKTVQPTTTTSTQAEETVDLEKTKKREQERNKYKTMRALVVNEKRTVNPFTKTTEHSHRTIRAPVITDNGLFDIKMKVWVVQVGSFNSKSDAMRLVNQLRARQYSAFLQKIKTAQGVNHLVFVGPELKHQLARELATDIEAHYHLQSFVVSYKPMTLV